MTGWLVKEFTFFMTLLFFTTDVMHISDEHVCDITDVVTSQTLSKQQRSGSCFCDC